MIHGASRSKLNDAILKRYAYDSAKFSLFGLSLALKAPSRKLADVLVPLVVPGVADSTWHAEAHAEAVEHGEGSLDEQVHPRPIRNAYFTGAQQRLLVLILPKQTILKTLRLSHEAHAHLHAVATGRAL